MRDQRTPSPSPPRYKLRSHGVSRLAPAFVINESVATESNTRSSRRTTNSRVQGKYLRNRATSVSTESSKPSTKLPIKRRVEDPLEMLLREKKQAEKSGKGLEAFRLAEAAVEDWTNEEAALAAVREGRDLNFSSDDDLFGSPAGSASGSFPEAEERDRLLGEDRGKAISDILGKDKKGKAQLAVPAKVAGVYLWEEDWRMDDRMETTSELRSSTVEDMHPVIKDLKSALETGRTCLIHTLIFLSSISDINSRNGTCKVIDELWRISVATL